jgi:hypothetical protein
MHKTEMRQKSPPKKVRQMTCTKQKSKFPRHSSVRQTFHASQDLHPFAWQQKYREEATVYIRTVHF